MLLQMGLFFSTLFNLPLTEALQPEESQAIIAPLLLDLKQEIYKAPCRKEYICFLHGSLEAMEPFVAAYGPTYQENYTQLKDNFSRYKENPSPEIADLLAADISAILPQELLPTSSYIEFNEPMLVAMQTALFTLEKTLRTIDPSQMENKLYLLGQAFVLYLLADTVSDTFDEDFEEFSDLFDEFMEDPCSENRENTINELHLLQASLST